MVVQKTGPWASSTLQAETLKNLPKVPPENNKYVKRRTKDKHGGTMTEKDWEVWEKEMKEQGVKLDLPF